MLRFDAVPDSVKALLLRLAPDEALNGFSLGGGTSLALRFGHRLSVDLDFFTLSEFSTEAISLAFNFYQGTVIGQAKNSLTLDVGGVKLDLLRHAYHELNPPEVLDGVRMVSLPDVSAMKLNAIANRGSKKDFYDMVELLEHFTVQELIGFFAAKYPSSDPFTVIRSLAWFDDAELEPDPLSLKGFAWEDVKRIVRNEVARM